MITAECAQCRVAERYTARDLLACVDPPWYWFVCRACGHEQTRSTVNDRIPGLLIDAGVREVGRRLLMSATDILDLRDLEADRGGEIVGRLTGG